MRAHVAPPSGVRRVARALVLASLPLFALVIAFTGCGRTSLEPETLDAGQRAASCGPATCPGGCCEDDGTCRPGTELSACGARGEACDDCRAHGSTVCTSSGVCGRPEPTCGPDTCEGCCDARGRCLFGTEPGACGTGGGRCATCARGETCVPRESTRGGACFPTETCGPDTCDGCCVGTTCVTATTPFACGAKGEQCTSCGTNEACNAVGQCVATGTCNPKSCPTGCCVGDICAVGTQETACGTAGALCQNCASRGALCQAGACVAQPCGPGNCAGCCRDDGTCDSLGIENDSCGQGGGACADCSDSGSFCNGLVSPRRCNDAQTTCPAPYETCAPGTSMPVTPPRQKVCTDAQLDALVAACSGGPDTPTCVAALGKLSAGCRGCLSPFAVPFDRKTGLWACAASFVNGGCRRALGCAADCFGKSCGPCADAAEGQCTLLVSAPPVGQCAQYAGAANCATVTLTSGVCSQFSYSTFGAWLRGVGDHFCGNGP